MALPYAKPVVCPILVGREPHLESLQGLLAQASGRQGQVVLVAGEAGIGKSRLLAEVCQRASGHEALILQGSCFEQDASFPYAPLIDLLRAFFARRSAAEIFDLLGPLGGELVKLLPELGVHGVQPTAPLEPEAEKRRLFETLARFLCQLSERQPLLVIVEDIHWADKTSLDFLHFFARRLPSYPILLLASYRREEVSPSLQHLLAKLDRERLAHEIVLAPLSRDEVDAMLRAIFELKRPVRSEFLEAVFELTEGNPFFIEEVLGSLIAAGDIFLTERGWDRKPLEELHIPRSIKDAVQRRLKGLSPEARQVVMLAAVAGRRFDFALLRELTGHDERELLQLVKELIATQLVVEESAERFAFRHALTREAIYTSLLARERKALHETIVETLERLHAAMPEAHLADLAYHFYEAGAWERAFDYARRAGERAHSLYAPQAAADHFTHALEAARRQGMVPPPSLYRVRGWAYDTLGDFERARADLETALKLAETSDRQAEWQALLDLGRLWAAREYARSGDYFMQALALARTLDDPAALAHSLNRIGNWHLNIDEPQRALDYHQEALVIFESLGDKRAVAETLDLLGVAYGTSDDQLASVNHFERSVALFRELDDRRGWASCQINLAELRGQWYIYRTSTPATIDPETAMREGEEALALARAIGWRAGEAWALMALSGGFCLKGDYARGLECAQQGLELAEEIGNSQWAGLCHFALGSLHLDLLAAETAIRHAEQGVALAKKMRSTLYLRYATYLLSQAYLLYGVLDKAQTLLDEILPDDTLMQTTGQRMLWAVRAELALAKGDPDGAFDIAERLIATAPNMAPGRVIPYLWKLRGEALAALGQVEEARTSLEAAHELAAKQMRRSLQWRTLVSLGKLYHTRKRFKEAEVQFEAAREIIERLAATIPDEALRSHYLRQASALMPPSPRQTVKGEFGGLTEREREVAVLITQGKSNKAIARALDLSERTVEKHISNIFSKLDFHSRAQLIAWVINKGWSESSGQRS